MIALPWLLLSLATASTSEASQRDDDSAAPAGFKALLVGDTDSRGSVLPIPNLTLTVPGASWAAYPIDYTFTYNQTYSDYGSYRLTLTNNGHPGSGSAAWRAQDEGTICVCPATAFACTGSQVPEGPAVAPSWPRGPGETAATLPLRPNRRYIVAAVIRTLFPRLTTEINLGVSLWDDGGPATPVPSALVGADRVGGLPSSTRELPHNVDGWVRYEWSFVTPPNVARGMPVFQQYITNLTAMPQLEIAELVLVETAAEPLKPLPGAEGLEFKGSAGSLPMSVLECTAAKAVTTAANYTFFENGTVHAWQNLEFPRLVAEWQLSVQLSDLKVLSFVSGAAGRCIVGNSAISIGVQVDGLLGFVPQVDAVATLVNSFGGDFNRIHDGHLLTEDDFGGMTVTPAIPAGSGKLARWRMVTKGLLFPDFNATDTNTTEQLAPGWSVAWQLSAGERLFSSVMPNRPYDWEGSFDFMWFTCASNADCREYAKFTPATNALLGNVTALVMWHTAAKVYGSSAPGPYEPFPNASEAQRTIDVLHANGKAALPYMSAFYHNTRNASEYVGRVKQWRDRFHIDGIYSDGLPEYDWLCAYEEVRMLREIFPSGKLVFHDTMHRPIAEYRAFLHTYATALYMGEGVRSNAGAYSTESTSLS